MEFRCTSGFYFGIFIMTFFLCGRAIIDILIKNQNKFNLKNYNVSIR